LLTIAQESDPLIDTAESLRAKPRTPSHTKFYPVGHISLDDSNDKPGNFVLDLPAEGVYWIKTFYISKALRSKGIGRAAMDIVESMAIDEPLCAKTLALDTAEKEMQKRIYIEKTGSPPGVSSNSGGIIYEANTLVVY
jgi:GNAT superfamily N-acetyltransferase